MMDHCKSSRRDDVAIDSDSVDEACDVQVSFDLLV